MKITLDDARIAFQNSVPERQDAFDQAKAQAWDAAQHNDMMKQWYPNEVLRLAKEEGRKRLDMAAARVKELLDSGWEPSVMETVDHAFREMFTRYDDMRKNAYNDLENGVAGSVMEVAGLYPPDQPGNTREVEFVLQFSRAWVEASNKHFADLKVYRPRIDAQSPVFSNLVLLHRGSSSLAELIGGGEIATTEFKSTLRMNLKTGKRDRAIEQAALKPIAAFLNTGGGTLLIGIRDDGTPLGLNADGFSNEDKMLLHLVTLAKDYLGGEHALNINPTIEDYKSPIDLSNYRVLVVHCEPSKTPVFLDDRFYARFGPSSQEIKGIAMVNLIRQRFPA